MSKIIPEPSDPLAEKRMKLRYAGTCRVCSAELPAGTEAIYERATKTVRCLACPGDHGHPQQPDAVVAEPLDTGQAGASARREYERRKAKDEQRVREKWGRFSPIAFAIRDERQSTAAWAQGADGEERIGEMLNKLAQVGIAALHDRRIPGTKANIDHIAVTPAGIWVIDAKRYSGRPELKIEGGFLRPRVATLTVGGRDRTKLVDGVVRQVSLVTEAVPGVPVRGALCFIGADWPMIGGDFRTQGVAVMWPRLMKKTLLSEIDGPLSVPAVTAQIAQVFKSA